MILVVGGTGTLGSRLTARLLERGLAVRVLARHAGTAPAPDSERFDVWRGDVTRREDVAAAMKGVSTVVSAAHGFLSSPAAVDRDGNVNIIGAAAAAGADVVLMSIVGVAADSPVDLFRMKHAAEERLRGSGVGWTVIRPTAYLETWIDVLEQTATRSGRPLIFGRGRNPINFVSADDVADLVARVACDPATRGDTLSIGGPQNLTMLAFAAAIQRAAGRVTSARHVPRAGLRTMATVMRPFKPALARQARSALLMDSSDMTFDPHVTRDAYPDIPCTALEDLLAARTPAGPAPAPAAAALNGVAHAARAAAPRPPAR